MLSVILIRPTLNKILSYLILDNVTLSDNVASTNNTTPKLPIMYHLTDNLQPDIQNDI